MCLSLGINWSAFKFLPLFYSTDNISPQNAKINGKLNKKKNPTHTACIQSSPQSAEGSPSLHLSLHSPLRMSLSQRTCYLLHTYSNSLDSCVKIKPSSCVRARAKRGCLISEPLPLVEEVYFPLSASAPVSPFMPVTLPSLMCLLIAWILASQRSWDPQSDIQGLSFGATHKKEICLTCPYIFKHSQNNLSSWEDTEL